MATQESKNLPYIANHATLLTILKLRNDDLTGPGEVFLDSSVDVILTEHVALQACHPEFSKKAIFAFGEPPLGQRK